MRTRSLILAAAASSLTLSSQLRGQDPSALDSIARAAEARGFSGAVIVAKDGKIILEKGYGLSNRAENIPFTASTIVQIGSNTKDFTAVAILQLQDQHRLSVDDKLSRFFPNAPADKRDITVWQLLKHRAGFPLGLGGDFDPVSREQLLDSAMAFKLLFPPGSRESYSNTGYSILAAIIEKVSGKSYDEYIRDNILAPLGLTHTGFLLPGFDLRDLAHGYRGNGEDAGTMLEKPHAADGPYWNLRGNGGMLSTVGDMYAFYRALFETDKLLKPETRQLMFDPSQPMGLAGSDLINFFLYERVPDRGLELMIASTNAAMKAPLLRGQLAPALGLPDLDRGENKAGAGAPLARSAGKPVLPGQSALIDDFVAVLNKGDTARLQSFIAEHFLLAPGQPSAEQRAIRLAGVHADLGNFSIVQKTLTDGGPIQVVVKTERAGEAMLILDMDNSPPYRIRRFGIQVGG